MAKRILYRVYYANELVYVGRTSQPLQTRLRGHFFKAPMMRTLDINMVTKVEYTELTTEADMFLYEIYFINLWKPKLNVDDKSKEILTVNLPDVKWQEFTIPLLDKWKEQIAKKDADMDSNQQSLHAYRVKLHEARQQYYKGLIDTQEFTKLADEYRTKIDELKNNTVW